MAQSTLDVFLARLHHPMLAMIDLSLDRMMRLLSLLGNPQKKLPPVVHVAGTNGKGSLNIYIQSILEAAGYRVNRYTSPHLVHFSERIILSGKEIKNDYLESLIKHVSTVLTAQPATFFEATTAAAFVAFAENPADVLLLETGMGGKLDATNVVAKPRVAAITPIDFDHTEYLGKTLTAIAGEKAGIIKRGVPVVIGRQREESMEVLMKKAAELAAPVYRLGHEFHVEGNIYRSAQRTLELKPALLGQHQFDNAATAIACLEQMPEFTITDAHIAQGLAAAKWPARLQYLTNRYLLDMLPKGAELLLDGGHNAQGAGILAQWLEQYKGKEVCFVTGLMKTKDMEEFFTILRPYPSAVYAVPITSEPEGQTAEAIAKAASALGIEAHAMDSVQNALQTIAQRAKTPDLVCICGSLYLARTVLTDIEKNPD